MAYVDPNFKTKKALKEAVKAGEPVTVFWPGIQSSESKEHIYVSGPHYPQPHMWYATVLVKDGRVVKVID